MLKLLEPVAYFSCKQIYLKINGIISPVTAVSTSQVWHHLPLIPSIFALSNLNKRWLSTSKDVTPVTPSAVKKDDILLQNIRSAINVEEVLATVRQHHTIMNRHHVTQALRALLTLQSAQCSSTEKSQILNSSEFESLCHKLNKESRAMDVSSLIDNLKVLSYFEVPVTSALVQGFFHLIKHHLNDLTLQEITFLSFLCSKFEEHPLVEALKMALPLVFEAQLKPQLDRDDPRELATLLHYAVYNKVSEDCCEELVQSLCDLPIKSFLPRDAFKVAVAVFSAKHFSESQVTLAHRALEIITSKLRQYKHSEIKYLLGKVVEKSTKHHQLYNEQFFNSYVQHILGLRVDFQEAAWTLKKLTAAAHTSIPLLDYVAEKLEAEPDCLESSGIQAIFTLPSGFANADYKPNNWNQIRQAIYESHKLLPKEKIELPWIRFVLDLTFLDCIDDKLLHHVFSDSFLEKFLARGSNILDYVQLLTVYQVVKVLHPEYTGPFPADSIIEKAKEINGANVTEFPLQPALEKAFGGKSYVLTRVFTKLGHFINHAVAIRRGGFPVALNQHTSQNSSINRIFIEDLNVPSDSQIVLVLAVPPGSLSRNGRRLRGSMAARSKTLEASGFAVVTIATEIWQELTDHEKIPYLMQAIRLEASAHYERVGCY